MNWFNGLKSTVKTDVLLSRYTTFKIGGKADFFIEPQNIEELKRILKIAHRNRIKIFLLGSGSNILVADEGVRGVVIRLNSSNFKKIILNNNSVKVGAGLKINQLLNFCLKKGLSGLEFLAGIPGTVGGAVVMNAGTKEGSIGDRIREVLVMDYHGKIKNLRKPQLKFAYRYSNISSFIVLEAVLDLVKENRKDILSKIKQFLDYRKRTQELSFPSAGCIFKNPKGLYAGKLIEACGLKGKSIGDAQVSLKHANFIINRGMASAKDVLKLIDYIRERVKKKFNVNLEPEIKLW